MTVPPREDDPATPAAPRAAGQTALEVRDATYRYDALEALRGVSLTVLEGEAVALIGVNGAGKTTLLNLAAGLLRARTGSLHVFGATAGRGGLRAHMRRGIVLVPEGRHVVTRLSVADNILLGGSCRGWRQPPADAVAFAYEVFPELSAMASRRAGTLSGGQQQMLAIARALVASPRVLLLDEPSQGLAPLVAERLAGSLRQLQQAGITMLIVEQNLAFARQCTSRLYAIAQGTVRFTGGWAEFAAEGDLIGAYL